MKIIATHYPPAGLSSGPLHLGDFGGKLLFTDRRSEAKTFDSEADALAALVSVEQTGGDHFRAWYDRKNVVFEGAPGVKVRAHG